MTRRRTPFIVTVSAVMVVGAAPLTAVGSDGPTTSETPVEEASEEVTGTTDEATGETLELDAGGDDPLREPTVTGTNAGTADALMDGNHVELEGTTDDATLSGGALMEGPDAGLLERLFALVEDTDPSGDDPDGDAEDSGDGAAAPADDPASQEDPADSTDVQEPAGPASQDGSAPGSMLDAEPVGAAARAPVLPGDPARFDDADPGVEQRRDIGPVERNPEAELAFLDLRLIGLTGLGAGGPTAPWTWLFDPGAYTRHPGQRTTAPIVEQLLRLDVEPHVIGNVLAPFPVAGPAGYTDDWGALRLVPTIHAHEGTDIFAARGTPVVASFDGVISHKYVDSRIGGNGLKLVAEGGTYAYYAHLDGFAPGVVPGARVAKGTVLGYVGDTGNALGTPPHLHYELHPQGGPAVPPVPYLDAWLEEARAEVLMLRGPGIDASMLRPAPVPIPPPVSRGPGTVTTTGRPSMLDPTPAGLETRGLSLLSVWVLLISVGYVSRRRRGTRGASAPGVAAATARGAQQRDALAPLLPAPEARAAHLAA